MSNSNQKYLSKNECFIIFSPFVLLLLTGQYERIVDNQYQLVDYENSKNIRMLYGLTIGCAIILLMPMLLAVKDNTFRIILWLVFFFIPLAALSWNMVINYNCSKDVSVPQLVSAKVVWKDKHSNRGRARYNLVTRNNNYDARALRVSVTKDFFDLVKRDDYIELTIRDGYLGYKWIESCKMVKGEI